MRLTLPFLEDNDPFARMIRFDVYEEPYTFKFVYARTVFVTIARSINHGSCEREILCRLRETEVDNVDGSCIFSVV